MKYSVKMRAERDGRHISGAEGITETCKLESAVHALLTRAWGHSNGMPDSVTIKVRQIDREVMTIPALKVTEPPVHSLREAKALLRNELEQLGVEAEPVLDMLYALNNMRGAVLLDTETLQRLEADQERGIRATCMDYEGNDGGSKNHFQEALCLASKVAGCPYIIGELCISDDAEYTTGYFASKQRGYIRIANSKEKGDTKGGRIFLFRGDRAALQECVDYLENQPVLVVSNAGLLSV